MSDTEVREGREQLRAELAHHTIYELLGGEQGVRTIVDRFYDRMDDEEFAPIRAMHQPDLGPMRVGLFEFLSGWLGGPQLYVERKGSPCLTGAHLPFRIDARASDLWMRCMTQAMRDAGVADRYRDALLPALQGIAGSLRNDDRELRRRPPG